MEDLKPPVGGRIREARNQLGLTQSRFAVRLGTTRRRVIAWEGGENVPSAFYLLRIAAATGQSIDFFLDGTEADVDLEAASMPITRDLAEALLAAVRQEVAAAVREVVAA